MKDAAEWYSEFGMTGSIVWIEDIRRVQRDAWEAGAEAMREQIADSVVVYQGEILSNPFPPFPEGQP